MRTKKLWAVLVVVVAAGLLASAVRAEPAAYRIDWYVVAGGGGDLTSQTSGYRLQGTAGQPAAGALIASPTYGLNSGYWVGLVLAGNRVMLPLVIRSG